jgi:hypothetical protein
MEAVFRLEGVRVRPGSDFNAEIERVLGPGSLRLGRAPVPPPARRAWSGA